MPQCVLHFSITCSSVVFPLFFLFLKNSFCFPTFQEYFFLKTLYSTVTSTCERQKNGNNNFVQWGVSKNHFGRACELLRKSPRKPINKLWDKATLSCNNKLIFIYRIPMRMYFGNCYWFLRYLFFNQIMWQIHSSNQIMWFLAHCCG